MSFGGSTSSANLSIKQNASLRRHGKGIFGKDASELYSHGDGQKFVLPKASPTVREAFIQKELAYRRRELIKWVITTVGILLIALVVYHAEGILRFLGG